MPRSMNVNVEEESVSHLLLASMLYQENAYWYKKLSANLLIKLMRTCGRTENRLRRSFSCWKKLIGPERWDAEFIPGFQSYWYLNNKYYFTPIQLQQQSTDEDVELAAVLGRLQAKFKSTLNTLESFQARNSEFIFNTGYHPQNFIIYCRGRCSKSSELLWELKSLVLDNWLDKDILRSWGINSCFWRKFFQV